MKTLMWLVVIFLWLTAMVLVLGVAGVITVNRSPGEVTMHVNLKTFELETRELADAGKQFLDRAEQNSEQVQPPSVQLQQDDHRWLCPRCCALITVEWPCRISCFSG